MGWFLRRRLIGGLAKSTMDIRRVHRKYNVTQDSRYLGSALGRGKKHNTLRHTTPIRHNIDNPHKADMHPWLPRDTDEHYDVPISCGFPQGPEVFHHGRHGGTRMLVTRMHHQLK